MVLALQNKVIGECVPAAVLVQGYNEQKVILSGGKKILSDVHAWKVSLHGGHSGEFCDHAESTLQVMLEAAVQAGYHTFGVSEHTPRSEERFLYQNELARGWDVPKIENDFRAYTTTLTDLADSFADRLIVLRGFEAEVIPTASYKQECAEFRSRKLPDGRPAFDYFVGSVHFVNEIQIDGNAEECLRAFEEWGSLEMLAVQYYDTVAEMAQALQPDVVGHLDLIKKTAKALEMQSVPLDTPVIVAAAERALESVLSAGAILDLNTAGWRKGLGEPYPAPWLIKRAAVMGVPFCFGDDSHRPSDVGSGIDQARDYLLMNGVDTVTVLTRDGDRARGSLVKRVVPL